MQEQLSRLNTRFPNTSDETPAVSSSQSTVFGTGFFEIKVDQPTVIATPSPVAIPATGAGAVSAGAPILGSASASTWINPFEQITEAPAWTPEKIEIKKPVIEESLQSKERTLKNGNETATFITNADLLMKHGETVLASHLIRQCLYLNSEHPEALKRLAVCLTKERDLPIKTKVYETLVKSDLCFENLALLGHCYYQQAQDQKAREVYFEALSTVTEESKGLFEVYKNLGNLFMREGDFENAEEHYNKAFTLNPRSDVLLVNLGTLAMQESQHDLAVNRFRQSLEINPKNDKAWVGLSLAHNVMGDHVLSRANLENALDINPNNRTAVHLAASWGVRDQDYSFGIDALTTYLSSVDCDEEMSLLLIHLFCVRNQFMEALFEVERLLLWDPTNQRMQQVEQEIRNAQKQAA